ncbi:MAG: hypothetical protein E6G97_16015 [Alphaproteobacteria bacterium]|nr:MAG: hypothetical protein E6G97_16015 [Alphaproteobacteria bacterium]
MLIVLIVPVITDTDAGMMPELIEALRSRRKEDAPEAHLVATSLAHLGAFVSHLAGFLQGRAKSALIAVTCDHVQ